MEIAGWLFEITGGLYIVAAVLYFRAMVGGLKWSVRAAPYIACAGLVVQCVGVVVRGVYTKHMPFTNLAGSLLSASLGLVAVYLFVQRKQRLTSLGGPVMLMAAAAVVSGLMLPQAVNPSLVPALKSPWSSIHIVSCLLGYATLAVSFVAAVAYLVQERLLKSRRFRALQSHLPSLDSLDRLTYGMVSLGFPMLTLGVVTGALWAQSAWGNYWSWDPKETWSLITWIVYAVYLHVRIVRGWQGKWANRLIIAGYLCILITYFWVTLFTSGMHSYKW